MRIKRPAPDSPPRKSARVLRHPLISMPDDVLQTIFVHLSASDIVNISCCCKYFREELHKYIFERAKLTWSDLVSFTNDIPRDFAKFIGLVRLLRITDYYSYGEWQIDIFKQTLWKFPRLESLSVNSINSSNWLKYRANASIHHLSLYFDRDRANASGIIRTNTIASTNPKIFNLNHLGKFERLKSLDLDSYHFNWDPHEVESSTQLENLTMTNCTWEYPFNLSQFNSRGHLKTLSISYNNNHPFVLSERFTHFLNNPLGSNSSSLILLNIDFSNYADHSWCKHLSTRQFELFSSIERFPNLQLLQLYGWLMNLRNFLQFIDSQTYLDQTHLHTIKLSVEATDVENIYTEREKLVEKFTKLPLKVLVSLIEIAHSKA